MADLAQQLLDAASKGPTGLAETDRLALLQASTKLSEALENPLEKFFRLFMAIYDPINMRLAVDLNLVDIVLGHNGPISLEELAQKSKCDPNLLQRILRMLVPLGVFVSPTPSTCAPTPFTPVLSSASPFPSAIIHFTHLYTSISAIPDYLAQTGYKNPTDAHDAPFNLAFNCKGSTYFDFVARSGNERLGDAFNKTMEMQKSKDEAELVRSYPAVDRLKQDDPERVLFVDVGGNVGHQVKNFGEKYSSLPGKLVLEDLPQVVDKAVDLPPSIAKIGHDFFTPQPEAVKGAKAFYLKMILHDWPEKQAKIILSHIVDVMADDSVVLVHEALLPETGVSHLDAKMDWHMFNMGALERTEKQWAELADSVGLKINGVWWEDQGLGRRGLIEMSAK
ncbi:S-adenosyl-L-methionine-dependent methyltransferase [Setomelanomma holmii]|uniref:S-adenosyl-L-methionine-dependent methyltransferase n=1 Tax=Setomelanomma holmii TaxID=210430 RepID=A0A9P4HBM8_9PLEO|nr:S-adenosyl-L-methionine-dependent methyltransferase [Setomelanomma holmii]